MAVISPILLTSSLVTDVLTKIRRGVALARMDNTADFAAGVMCDLPEKIDFELNLVSKHQHLSRNVVLEQTDGIQDGEVSGERVLSDSGEHEVSIEAESRKNISGEVESAKESSKNQNGRRSSAQSGGTTASQENSGTSGSTQAGSQVQSRDGSQESTQAKEQSKSEEKTQAQDGRRDQSKGLTGERSNSNGRKSENTSESECSDKCQTMQISRRYWRLDEETGALTQAS